MAVLTLGLLADFASKSWSFRNVAPHPVELNRAMLLANPDWQPPIHEPFVVLPGNLLDLQLVINHGAVFGIGAQKRIFFIAFTVAALAAGLLVFGKFTSARHRLAHIAIGLILAGGIGNLYDRIVFGVVRDFLHMMPGRRLPFHWRWPGGSPELFPWVYNIADVMLLAGMIMLMLHINLLERHRRRRTALDPVGAPVTTSPAPAARSIHPPDAKAPATLPDSGPWQS